MGGQRSIALRIHLTDEGGDLRAFLLMCPLVTWQVHPRLHFRGKEELPNTCLHVQTQCVPRRPVKDHLFHSLCSTPSSMASSSGK